MGDDDEPETKAPETEIGGTPPKAEPAAADISVPAETMLTQEYMQKGVFFLLILGAVLYFVRRRRASYEKLDEKSVA